MDTDSIVPRLGMSPEVEGNGRTLLQATYSGAIGGRLFRLAMGIRI